MPQLQINQGPQDALLYDNSRSYFTNVGYSRTSNFQIEYIDVDPQNTPSLGATMQFVIPKSADLLGCCDLQIEFDKVRSWTPTKGSMNQTLADPSGTNSITSGNAGDYSTLTAGQSAFVGWVESLGYAMIDRIVFSVGSHDIETITGDQLYITNELMRDDDHRFGHNHCLKTGRPLIRADCNRKVFKIATKNYSDADGSLTGESGTASTGSTQASATGWDNVDTWDPYFDDETGLKSCHSRLIMSEVRNTDGSLEVKVYDGKKLTIPLGLFFTKNPGAYFPIAAIAGCNDIRISVKLRPIQELLVMKQSLAVTDGVAVDDSSRAAPTLTTTPPYGVNIKAGGCKLRCHYVHVTGPEAGILMNQEHVRLLKLWSHHSEQKQLNAGSTGGSPSAKQVLFDMELPFLHPISELVIVIRKETETGSSMSSTANLTTLDQGAKAKNYFAFHGGGKDPNIESHHNMTKEASGSNSKQHFLTVGGFKLSINGKERHTSLTDEGLDRDYLMNRLLPMLHSNTSSYFGHTSSGVYNTGQAAVDVAHSSFTEDDMKCLGELMDRKEIYVYPFCLNPEGPNPSGAVNFSKVSHSKLRIEGTVTATDAAEQCVYRCDVYGLHYNWLQIKDGRALTSFA